MGSYQTNCYIVSIDNKQLIIDPGVNALPWIQANVTNPIAILNTHGHFDHVWSNQAVKEMFDIPLYCPRDDAFMLTQDPLSFGTPKSTPDHLIFGDEIVEIEGIKVKFRHFAGHTPGCSIIEIEDVWFSGDFLFEGSIGRWDFPASNGEDMVKSLQKMMSITENFTLYPGHGGATTLKAEQTLAPLWIQQVKRTLH